MDNPREQKKKTDGIRRRSDGVRATKEKIFSPAEEKVKVPAEPKKPLPVLQKPISQSSSVSAPFPVLPEKKEEAVMKDHEFRQEINTSSRFVKKRNFFIFFLGVGTVFLVILLVSTVFARIIVTVKPLTEQMQIEDTQVIFDASISEINHIAHTVPAEFLTFTNTASIDFDTTGNDYIEQKAIGAVRIYNAFSTSPQGLVINTRFITDSGILFRLVKSVIVPGAKNEAGKLIPQYVDAQLAADMSGEESNISGNIKLFIPGFKDTPKYAGFYAIATDGFSGGSKGQMRMVTKEDIAAAQEKVTKKVFDELRSTLVRKIPANFIYVESLSEIQITDVSIPREKTRADRFTAQASAVARVFIFREADILNFLHKIFLQNDEGKEIINKSDDLHYRIKNTNYDKKQVQAGISGSVKTRKIINKEELIGIIRGRKEGSLIEALKQRREIATFKVTFFPPWIYTAPANINKIDIIVDVPAIQMPSSAGGK